MTILNEIQLPVWLTPDQAQAYAQFLKHVSIADYKGLARDTAEAYAMLEAGEAILAALSQVSSTTPTWM